MTSKGDAKKKKGVDRYATEIDLLRDHRWLTSVLYLAKLSITVNGEYNTFHDKNQNLAISIHKSSLIEALEGKPNLKKHPWKHKKHTIPGKQIKKGNTHTKHTTIINMITIITTITTK